MYNIDINKIKRLMLICLIIIVLVIIIILAINLNKLNKKAKKLDFRGKKLYNINNNIKECTTWQRRMNQ